MPKDFDRLVELLNFERLFQYRYWTDLQDAIENFTIGITRNNDYVKIRIDLFRRPIDLVARSVRELQIEEHQIELLFSKAYDRVFSGSDYDRSESPVFGPSGPNSRQSGAVFLSIRPFP